MPKGIDYCHRLTQNTTRHPQSPATQNKCLHPIEQKNSEKSSKAKPNGKHCAAPGQLICLDLEYNQKKIYIYTPVWVQFGFRVTRSSDFGAARRTGHQFERSGIHYTPFCTIFCCVRPEIWTEWRKGGTERSGQKSLELPASSIAWPNYIVGIWQINSPKLHTHSARKEKTRGGRTAGFQRELSSLQPDNSHKSSQQRRRQDAPGKSAIKICANFVFLLACNWY